MDGRVEPLDAPSGQRWSAAARVFCGSLLGAHHCVVDAALHNMALLFVGRVEVKVASDNSTCKLFALAVPDDLLHWVGAVALVVEHVAFSDRASGRCDC